MAAITITVPDEAVATVAALIRSRYPDLVGDDLDVGRRGVGRMIREVFRTSEANRIEQSLQEQVNAERLRQLAAVDAVLAQII